MMAGVLPAPTPTAGLPEEYADLTIRLGTSIQPMMFSGAPALTAASRTTLAAAIVLFLARGWGLMIMPFLVFSAISVLNIAVDVGFVVGMTAHMTPTGSAIFLMP